MQNHEAYTAILREQIALAAGRAEPISVALCAAKAQQVLSMQPTSVTVSVSSGILKNARNVVVPNTNGLVGIPAAVSAGIVCGDPDKGMQVIGKLSQEQRDAVVRFIETTPIDVSCAETECEPYVSVTLYARTSYSRVVIANRYSNFVEVMKNGEALVKRPIVVKKEERFPDPARMNVREIYEYSNSVEIDGILDLLRMQIANNMRICEAGLADDAGMHVGKILLAENGSDPKSVAKAYSAAGCRALMNGCEMPVASLCGSGNQGIIAAVPLAVFARANGISEEMTCRALILSDLLTVYMVGCCGARSAVCGSVLAGCAASAAIAYLNGGGEEEVAEALLDSVSLISEIRCFGSKPSCVARAASAVETGFLGFRLSQARGGAEGKGESPDVDQVVRDLYRLASEAVGEADPTVFIPLKRS